MKPRTALLAAGVAFGIGLILLGLSPVLGHDAPTGWAYSMACCSNQDCGQLHTEVRATDRGWYVEETGEMIGYSDRRIKPSQDEFFHRCEDRRSERLPNGMAPTRCLYTPPQGS